MVTSPHFFGACGEAEYHGGECSSELLKYPSPLSSVKLMAAVSPYKIKNANYILPMHNGRAGTD
jgi:hypothetical protein